MNWGRVIFIFLSLMSLTTTAGFLYDQSLVALFVAACINLVSTLLKAGVKSKLSVELFASSLVADLHLIPAFVISQLSADMNLVYSLAIGGLIANVFSLLLVLIEAMGNKDEF